MSQSISEIWGKLRPYVVGEIQATGTGGGSGSLGAHDLSGSSHFGLLSDEQAPQFLKLDGTRQMTGSLQLASGKLVDGVDVSALGEAFTVHTNNPGAHHAPFVGLQDSSHTPINPDGGYRITVSAGDGISAVAGDNILKLGLRLASPSGLDVTGGLVSVSDLLAGNGLVMSLKRMHVGAGAGLEVSADAVGLQTPGTLGVASLNQAMGSHTHLIDASSSPGAASYILKSDFAGGLTLNKLSLRPPAKSTGLDIVTGVLDTVPLISVLAPYSATNEVGILLASRDPGDLAHRLRIYTDGKIGIGGGSTTPDVVLSRSAAGGFMISAEGTGASPGHLNVVGNITAGAVRPAAASPAPIYSESSTEQLRLAYSPSSYSSFTVDNGGNLEMDVQGQLVLDPVGRVVRPARNLETDLGSPQRKWLSVHAGELWVETLVAQQTVATIGGRILVGPTTVLEQDVLAASTLMVSRYNNLDVGDILYLEGGGKLEFMQVAGFYHNHVRNGSFEDWNSGVTLPLYWQQSGTVTYTRVASTEVHGRYVVQLNG